MKEITTIGLDIGKRVLQVHGSVVANNTVVQRKLRREEVLPFFAKLPPCPVGMEACGTSHHWAREIGKLGHDARLVPPNYVKPYIARQKNDAADAAAICEAVTRPAVRTTPVKSIDQQAAHVLQRAHELLARQRVKLINAMRGHMAEFGVVVASGTQNIGRLMERISDPDAPLPASVRAVLNILADQMVALSKKLDGMEAQMRKRCREDAGAARLITIPGVGVITACAVLAGVPDIHAFRSSRGFAAWLGLVPRQTSSGGKPRLGRITKMGDAAIRRLLVVGATSAIRWAKQKDGYGESWLGKMLAQKPVKVAAVALANKNARIIWALLTRQQSYRPA